MTEYKGTNQRCTKEHEINDDHDCSTDGRREKKTAKVVTVFALQQGKRWNKENGVQEKGMNWIVP